MIEKIEVKLMYLIRPQVYTDHVRLYICRKEFNGQTKMMLHFWKLDMCVFNLTLAYTYNVKFHGNNGSIGKTIC